ncbi:MAG: glycosyltransferase [Actinomycetota bacterium]|nr:glycosyltransferase [Actinomycetota bacterium]
MTSREGLRVALIGTAPPRRCGIATFTDDLRRALTALDLRAPAVQVALTDVGGSYEYGDDVVFEIHEAQRPDYRAAAEYLDRRAVDVVCVQHEFGIFGGTAGRHIEDLLDHVSAPVVTTLHTVLAVPPPALREATRRLAERSDRLVVLADQALELLETGYGIGGDSVTVIPHGVPQLSGDEPSATKRAIGAGGRTVLLTFGLLGPDKGIEVVIEALPAIVADHPEVLYLVLGATHPHVRRDHGETYRHALQRRVDDLGLASNVTFVDRYVDLDELRQHLAATDVYLTPYHGTDQIVSGTLAYAVGMGCAVVSTPYPYARELLAGERGELVPFGDAQALAAAVKGLLGDGGRRSAMRARARAHGRRMAWPAVARSYQDLFEQVIAGHERRPVAWTPAPIPRPTFAALRGMTDDTGLFQHSSHGVPLRDHGYCTDDVGRALVAAVQGAARWEDPIAARLIPTYLSFLGAAQRPDGRFDNLVAYDRTPVPGLDSEDTLGQALWGLGVAVGSSPDEGWRAMATELFDRALPAAGALTHTNAAAYAINGLDGYLQRFPGALPARRTMRHLVTGLVARLDASTGPGWIWFDEELTYGNAKPPEALLLAGRALGEQGWVERGLATLEFLLDATWADAGFDFVGNEGWHRRGGRRATYGQQPIEAGYTAQACVVAHEITGDARYLARARGAVEWLLGRNRLGVPLYDERTGRCVDGLDRHGASTNAGGESLVCALLALMALPQTAGGDPRSDGRSTASATN